MADYRELAWRRGQHGVSLTTTWPHISLGVSLHFDRKYGHLSLHLPIGVLIIGFIGMGES